jgi:hypothetical protein
MTTRIPGVEYDINVRWEKDTPHHPESVKLFKRMAEIDWDFCGDYFCWKQGGDGDNGETLMYELDILFEERDVMLRRASQDEGGQTTTGSPGE